MPTYPFEKKKYWIEPTPNEGALETTGEKEKGNEISSQMITAPPARKNSIVSKIQAVLRNLSGQDQSAAASDVSFLELGFDSLLLTQVAQAFRKEFGVKVTFRQLLEDYSTMETLAGYLDSQLPPEPLPLTATTESASLPSVSTVRAETAKSAENIGDKPARRRCPPRRKMGAGAARWSVLSKRSLKSWRVR